MLDLRAPEATEPDRAGGKAARLAELLQAGFPVPPGVVIPTGAFDRFVATLATVTEEAIRSGPLPDDLRVELERGLAAWEARPVAVRSSAVAEDLPGASFAGQYESVIDVVGVAAILDAVRACWASGLAPRLLEYREKHGLAGPPRIAVLVQELVQAEAAGVAFTADPVTGARDEVLVNGVRGLGERLVSGGADGDHWRVGPDAVPRPVRVPERALQAAQVVEIARLARRVADRAGQPQDIEWVWAAGRVHLVQARPITALPERVEWVSPEPGLWLRSFRLGEWLGDPLTPLFESWLLARMEDRLFERFRAAIPVPMPPPYHVTVNGWYYTTVNFVPRSIPHALGLLVRHLLPALIRNPAALSVILPPFAHRGMARFEAEWRSGPRSVYEDAVRSGWATVETADAAGLTQLIDRLADLAGDEVFYFFMVGGSAWKVEAGLAAFHRRHRLEGSYQDLLQGLADPSGDDSHLALSLDWYHPTLGELGLAQEPTDRRTRSAHQREIVVAQARGTLAGSALRRFDVLVERAQHFGRVREEQAHHLTLAWPLLRRVVRRLAQLQGVDPDEVWFLTRQELVDRADPALATERRRLWERQRRLSAPVSVGTMGFLQRKVFGRPDVQTDPAGLLRGAPASPGRATGRVRVVRGIEAFGTLLAGEILVAPATNPGWTPLFSRAAAVVTDTGSLMAHASLVAREFGIPAVVGTGSATRDLQDGELVLVDGTAGTVERVA